MPMRTVPVNDARIAELSGFCSGEGLLQRFGVLLVDDHTPFGHGLIELTNTLTRGAHAGCRYLSEGPGAFTATRKTALAIVTAQH